MRCPKCTHQEDKVIDSRSSRNGVAIRRRRICAKCGYRYTTYEEIIKAKLRVIKRDGRHEDFDKAKLLNGIKVACEKRPISSEQMDVLVEGVIEDMESEFEKDVPSQVIGRIVMNKLEKIDEVAFVRFASVYRNFKDVNQFLSAIKGIVGKNEK